ncbi:hypothetical protein Dsin_001687 [Dipteronia sinensis]|uniref:Pentatricopeptide repeat-containing protein n=1 Tax=Dipteronia sinensis TaxID=43782 RepID=A0AAE0EIP8_9ROSI|nr:hypothetical protein Dsin_001687 [Dipteronia sinensis]
MRCRRRFLWISLPSSNPQSILHYSTLSKISSESTHPTSNPIYTHLFKICCQECRRINTHRLFDERSHILKTCRIIHAHSTKFGFASKGLLGNAIVDLYGKCGNVDLANKVFYRLDNRDVFAWNSILSMYSKGGLFDHVVKSFALLWNSGVLPNEFTFAMVLSACARSVDVSYGWRIHCKVIKVGLQSNSFCQGALIEMYSKCNNVSDARTVFDGAVDLDTVSWTSMISGYVQAGLPEAALEVFEKMKKLGQIPDQVAFVTVINACVHLGRLDDACELFSQMQNPNVVAWNVMISGHAKRGYEAEALKFFERMRKAGVKSSRSTLGSVLSAISCLAAIDFGLMVHAEAIKQGLNSNIYVGSSLISMYAKCKKMESAKKVFDSVDERNIVLWNAMLGGYSQNGYAHEVMELFSEMKSFGFHADDFTYTSILSSCACLEYLEMGCQLHAVIIKNNLASNLFVGNALVDMYSKSGVLTEARQLFERMGNRDNVSWNAIIVGYAQEGDKFEAFNIFMRMILCGIVPDEVSLASILSACANVQGLKQGKQVHCLSVKVGLETSIYAGSSLIDMYAKTGDTGAAHKVLSGMPGRSVVSMNALIAGYSQNNLEKAIILYQEMQAEGLNPSEITFASLLDACDGPHKFNMGTQFHCVIVKMGLLNDDEFLGVSLLGMYMNSRRHTDARILFTEFLNPKSTVLWTAIISGHTQNDLNEDALHFYRAMRSNNALPDQATFVSVLRACALLSSLRDGRGIHSLIFHTGYDLDELTGSALVDMYAKCGDVKSSVQVFDEMGNKNFVFSWNSMIVGFAKHGYAEDALRIFDEMKETHVLPDDVTFLGVLTACSHAGKVSEGRQIFESMVNYDGIHLRVGHCACMIDLLGRGGFLKEAEEFIDKLNFEPDAKIWATLLGACGIHRDDIRGRRAAEKLIELEPQNSSPYVLLSNIYAALGKWNEVNSLRREMREKGVKKLPGCSWIVIGQKTNLFVAGDTSHPSADNIHNVLKNLTALMRKNLYIPVIDSFWHDQL